jgi:hypothetical protein
MGEQSSPPVQGRKQVHAEEAFLSVGTSARGGLGDTPYCKWEHAVQHDRHSPHTVIIRSRHSTMRYAEFYPEYSDVRSYFERVEEKSGLSADRPSPTWRARASPATCLSTERTPAPAGPNTDSRRSRPRAARWRTGAAIGHSTGGSHLLPARMDGRARGSPANQFRRDTEEDPHRAHEGAAGQDPRGHGAGCRGDRAERRGARGPDQSVGSPDDDVSRSRPKAGSGPCRA